MANLSYCSLEQTECYDWHNEPQEYEQYDWSNNPQEYKDLSSSEKEAYKDFIMIARDMVRLHDKLTSEGLFDDDENEEEEDLE